ncbi:MAG: sigma-E processing peptidase SpoIIGA [Lachnospiraceae bacterium]|nr:sigma-E processing peptidase SpoIIGA [Lachnospiraceae bacterium]
MQYQIYLDSLFIQEVVINFYVLMLCKLCLINTTTWKRMIFASIFAGGFQVGVLLLPFPNNIVMFYVMLFCLYIIGGFITIRIAFGTGKWKVYIKRITIYLFFTLIIGGLFLGILPRFAFYNHSQIKFMIFLVTGAGAYTIFGKIFWEKRQNMFYGRLKLIHCGKALEGRYFMDSGNSLVESISKKPVLIADAGWLFECFSKEKLFVRPVIYKSVGKSKGILYAYCMDELVIYGKNEAYTYEKVWVGVCREDVFTDKNYQIILPPIYGVHRE